MLLYCELITLPASNRLAVTSTEEHELNTLIQLFESRSFDQLVVAGKQYTKEYPHNGSGCNLLALGCKKFGEYPRSNIDILVPG